MASKVIKSSSIKNVVTRGYAAQAAALSKQTVYSLPDHQPEVTKLPSGSVVASLENNSPISRVAIFVKSGPAYETYENNGVSHMVRLAAGQCTKNFTAFGITRKVQQMGGVLVAQSGREHMSYGMSFLRDHLDEGFPMLSDIAMRPSFKPWEVSSLNVRLLTELHARSPSVLALESLHKAAFRDTSLGNSLFMPNHQIGKITPQQMLDFVNNTHTGPRFAFVGLGVDHKALVKLATSSGPASGAGDSASAAYGGGEIREETGGPLAYVAVAGSGAKFGTEEATSLLVAQFILGNASGVKYGSNASSKLAGFVNSAGGTGSAVAINANYASGGLFGFLLVEEANKAGDVLRAVAKGIRTLKVTDADVKNGKAKAKAAILMSSEATESELEEMGLQALLSGDYTPAERLAAIDKVSTASVQSALSSATKGKASMGAVGGLAKVPYLDQL